MWQGLEKISQQVSTYSTTFGKLWYLFVFLYRLIVVATIGGAVYGDEKSAFLCNTGQIGCKNMCFNQFNRISHIRFWSFQLLAVITPTVLFHFYTTKVAGEIEKVKAAEKDLEPGDDDSSDKDNRYGEKDWRKLYRRKESIGDVTLKKVYVSGSLEEIPYTAKIRCAYFVSVILRIAIEGLFIYLSYRTFQFEDPSVLTTEEGFRNFLFFRVPALFECVSDSATVHACSQHLQYGNAVTCWVSRPWEKTIFIGYMSALSALCFVLSVLELVYLFIGRFLCRNKISQQW